MDKFIIFIELERKTVEGKVTYNMNKIYIQVDRTVLVFGNWYIHRKKEEENKINNNNI